MGRFGLATAAALTAAAFVAAASASTSAVFLHAGPNPVHRGHKVIIRGNAAPCPAGSAVTLISQAFAHTHEFAGVPAVFALVRSGGKFGVRPVIPASRAPGTYSLSARCGGGNLGVTAKIHVVA